MPLYKEGEHDNPGNYRPISILLAISKILERVVHKQVSAYIKANKTLSEAQFGFRKGHSTTSCILKMLDNIYMNMD